VSSDQLIFYIYLHSNLFSIKKIIDFYGLKIVCLFNFIVGEIRKIINGTIITKICDISAPYWWITDKRIKYNVLKHRDHFIITLKV
jgi:hypothetical protein